MQDRSEVGGFDTTIDKTDGWRPSRYNESDRKESSEGRVDQRNYLSSSYVQEL